MKRVTFFNLRASSRWLTFAVTSVLVVGCSDNTAQRSTAPELTESEKLMAAGRRKAAVCTGCHGPNGVSRVPSYPSLAGSGQEYLSEQLHAFRSGERDDPVMGNVALNLSEEDIEVLSHFYASLPAPE